MCRLSGEPDLFRTRQQFFRQLAGGLVSYEREGLRQPPSPKVCLPGNGWTPRIADELYGRHPGGRHLTVNRYVVDRGQRRAVVLTGIRRRGV